MNKICDEIIAEIRRPRFVVVDYQNRSSAILSMMEMPREVQSALEEEEILPIELEARKRVLSSNFLAAPLVISMWRSGLTIAQMFGELPAVKRSKAKDNVNGWLSGSRVSENWAGSFDKFADFVESVIEGYLPWLLEACASLSGVIPTIGRHVPWAELVSVVNETIDRRRAAAQLVGQQEVPETVAPQSE